MVLNDKQKYLKNLIDIINMCEDITKDMDESIRIDLMTSFQQMIIYIGEQLENDQDKRDCKLIKEHNIIEKLENLCEEIYICSQIFSQNTVDIIKKSVSYIIEEINNLPITYRGAFLPYKASMWDSLESIWKAFANDEKCETSVVPIPYYEANSITGQWEYHYDGSIYPEDVPIVDYKNYILSEKKPDFIFFHNPYDDYNYVTKVHPDFFSKNLKKYCRKLVYVPYYANMGYLSKDAKSLPALHRADYLIFQSDAMKEGCLEQPFYERILTFGSPKFDKVLRYMAQKVPEPEEWGKRVLLALVCLGLVAFGYLESLVIRGAHKDGRAEDAQCVVILGAGVNGTTPSLMLSSRLQAALDFIADKPDIPIICSGGQGPGEDISEADCMADWLIAHGVDESRIYREDRSTSTQENFAYSEEIMAELGLDAGDMFAFVTNDYHIFRAGRIAGTDAACGVAATLPRSAYYDALQLNYYVREAFATGWLLLRGN